VALLWGGTRPAANEPTVRERGHPGACSEQHQQRSTGVTQARSEGHPRSRAASTRRGAAQPPPERACQKRHPRSATAAARQVAMRVAISTAVTGDAHGARRGRERRLGTAGPANRPPGGRTCGQRPCLVGEDVPEGWKSAAPLLPPSQHEGPAHAHGRTRTYDTTETNETPHQRSCSSASSTRADSTPRTQHARAQARASLSPSARQLRLPAPAGRMRGTR